MASDLEQKQEAEHFTVLDQATVPEKPFKPQRRLLLPVVFLAAVIVSVGLAYLKDILRDSPRLERELRALLPADVPLLTSIPRLSDAAERRKSMRFALAAVTIFVLGCALNIVMFLRLHPRL
jgi:capsular polysaccharide biosynthesis protein